jgi:hypothetical protein
MPNHSARYTWGGLSDDDRLRVLAAIAERPQL